jgi:cytochrome c-type biogenesis protein CcmH/NrfF
MSVSFYQPPCGGYRLVLWVGSAVLCVLLANALAWYQVRDRAPAVPAKLLRLAPPGTVWRQDTAGNWYRP